MLQIAPRRRLKKFREVTKHVDLEQKVRRLAEALDLTEARNPKVDLNYFTTSIPLGLSDEDRTERLSDLTDTVTKLGEKSDVVILGMWISPKA